jgi:hypothetical protein
MTTESIDLTFANLTAESSIADLCTAAYSASRRAALYDMRPQHGGACLASDEATIAYLRDPSTREALEAWLVSYAHDEQILAALSDDGRAEALASAWRAYEATVMQCRDAARTGGAS